MVFHSTTSYIYFSHCLTSTKSIPIPWIHCFHLSSCHHSHNPRSPVAVAQPLWPSAHAILLCPVVLILWILFTYGENPLLPNSPISVSSSYPIMIYLVSLANNQLTGPLPSFHFLNGLTQLYLRSNWLQGMIPMDFIQNAPRHKLVIVDIGDNMLSGTLDSGRLSPLEYLDLYMTGNQLVGIDDTLCERSD